MKKNKNEELKKKEYSDKRKRTYQSAGCYFSACCSDVLSRVSWDKGSLFRTDNEPKAGGFGKSAQG